MHRAPPLSPKENRLLAALPAADFERLRPQLTLVRLPRGSVLYESGAEIGDCYFPVSGLVSLLYTLEDGSVTQFAVVGNDGCVGVLGLLGGGTTPSRAVMQIAGQAYRVASAVLLAELQRGGQTKQVLLHYVLALMTQVSQTAVCNRYHTVEQQLCRWFLMVLDRVPSRRIAITQALISSILGVRRAGISAAAQAAGGRTDRLLARPHHGA